MEFIGQPYFLAGTALPDWLSALDRKVRVRRDQLLPWADGSGSPAAQFAAGILRHLDDDEWFHKTTGFEQATREMAQSFRDHLENIQDNPRAGFLGHITTELVLDGVLIAKDPRRLESYYDTLATVEPAWIEETVSQMTGRAVSSLAWFCERFSASRFLFDYLEDSKLLYRLNQVVRRIKLRPLPESTTTVIAAGRSIVERHLPDLLPADLFPASQQLKDNPP